MDGQELKTNLQNIQLLTHYNTNIIGRIKKRINKMSMHLFYIHTLLYTYIHTYAYICIYLKEIFFTKTHTKGLLL